MANRLKMNTWLKIRQRDALGNQVFTFSRNRCSASQEYAVGLLLLMEIPVALGVISTRTAAHVVIELSLLLVAYAVYQA